MALGLVACLGQTARADEVRRFTLTYSADSPCPSQAELVRQIQSYSPAAAQVDSGPSDLDARVVVAIASDQVDAVVDVQRADGSTRRELHGSACAEIARAIALIVALAMDPDAKSIEQGGESPPPTPAKIEHLPRAKPATRATPASRWFGIGAAAGFGSGAAPGWIPYAGVFLEFGAPAAHSFAPSVRVTGLRMTEAIDTRAGRADLMLLAVRFAGCPFHFGTTLFADPCLTFDYGRLEGTGHTHIAPQSASATWFGPGAAVRAGVRLLGGMSLALDAGVLAPLARDHFLFGPDVNVHHVPSIAAYTGLAFGFRS